jgi:hypothetical protein
MVINPATYLLLLTAVKIVCTSEEPVAARFVERVPNTYHHGVVDITISMVKCNENAQTPTTSFVNCMMVC